MAKARQVIKSVEHYTQLWKSRTADQLRSIANTKRFCEFIWMDTQFRDTLQNHPSEAQGMARSRGIDIDLDAVGYIVKDGCLVPITKEETNNLPLIAMRREWLEDLLTFRRLAREDGYSDVAGPGFNAWRRRQIARVNSEMGSVRGEANVHPAFSFELSKGCSVGCWFCAFGAEPLRGYFDRTPDNAQLWKGVLSVAVDLFGKAAQTGFCYGATEPFDNPHYLDFLEDYKEIVGVFPQTTSAVPLRNIQWTRRLLEMQRTPPAMPSRLSILNLGVLRRLYEIFTPEELLRFELLPQNRESILIKARAGKTLHKVSECTGKDLGHTVEEGPGSISCVSGFWVNMVDRSIQLVSPCTATDRRPLGFRVHSAGTFDNPKGFGDFIEKAMFEHMPVALPDNQAVAFREDLIFDPVEDGFTLASGFTLHSCKGGAYVREMGRLIAEGRHMPADITSALLDTGADIFAVRATLQNLFDKGLLEDLPCCDADQRSKPVLNECRR